ncbi:MAG: YceI family protein, partial [Flavobacteriales bacterium]
MRKDAKFEAEYIKCKQAIKSGISDTSKITIGSAENATNLSASDGNYIVDVTTSTVNWTGQKAIGKSHTGVIALKRGSLTISGEKITGGEIVADMTTLTDTDLSGAEKGKLESHLKSPDFFDTAKFGEATYTIVSGEKMNAVKYAVKGKLTVKGITKYLNCEINVIANNA